MKSYLVLGNLGQWTACVLFGAGIASMIFQEWHVADTIITTGALVFSAFTKVKLIHYEIEESKRRGRKEG